jgi:NTP pyrophosphohydrolases containing a Zn-finger, probably nucleic-acid-binding
VRNAEDVTFGGSGLNRAAAYRGTEKAKASIGDTIIFVWRGKILMDLENQPSLAKFEFPHPLCEGAVEIFLGSENNQNYIAFDISEWEPTTGDQPDPNVFFDPTQQQHPRLDKKYAFCELRGQMLNLNRREAELCSIAKGLFHWNTTQKYCSACGSLLKMTLSGWQKNCDNCGISHFPRTDPVVIMLITRGDKVLLGRSPKLA